MNVKALWHIDANTSVVKTEEIPNDRPGSMHVRSLYSLISLGTELTVARGGVPRSMHTHMRVPYMGGEFLFPVKYGYSLVGVIEGTEAICHLMHPHQDHCVVDPDACFEVPPGIPPKRATLASNLETALTGVWDGDVRPGQRVVIVGFGMIGSLIARIVSRIPDVQLSILDINDSRKNYADNMGFNLLDNPNEAYEPFDIAFHSSATQEGLQTALDLVGLEGKVIEMSWYGDRPVTLNLGGEFHLLRKKLISSQVSRIPASMQPAWDHRRRKQAVFELLKDPSFDQHITNELTLQEAAQSFNTWRDLSPRGLGYCIAY